MAVKMRLTRMGDKKSPFYRIVVTDSRNARDGAYIDKVGHYNPLTVPAAGRGKGEGLDLQGRTADRDGQGDPRSAGRHRETREAFRSQDQGQKKEVRK